MDSSQILETITLWSCLSWLAFHQFVLNRGFVLRRKGFSTDTRISAYIMLTSFVWFFATLYHAIAVSAELLDGERLLIFLATMARAPNLPFLVSCCWILIWTDAHLAERSHRPPHLWSSANVLGPFDWRAGLPRLIAWGLNSMAILTVIATASAAVFLGESLLGVLVVIGLGLFLADGISRNPFISTSHKYTDDRLRVVLATGHHEGTVYILPSRGLPFSAVWSPKIEDEHRTANHEIMAMFRHFRSGSYALSEPLERLRTVLVAYQSRVQISTAELEHLAAWIYVTPDIPFNDARTMGCVRAQGVNLLGRELIYALCHAEYLIFMAQSRLSKDVQDQLGRLRSMKRSGAGQDRDTMPNAVGYKAGLEGLKEATKHIYSIFDEEIDENTHDFSGTQPPAWSVALSKRPSSIEEYVSELWDASCAHSESTFTAMYFFSLVWSMELGNVNGWHIFPVRCHTRDGDLVGQELVWRQAWYLTLIVQLIVKSPLLLGVFAMGIV